MMIKSLFITLFTLCSLSNIFSQNKIDKIKSIIDYSDYNSIGETLIDAFMTSYTSGLEISDEVNESIKKWSEDGYNSMLDSLVLTYDQLFDEKEINQMLEFYNTKLGKKIIKLTPEITESSIKASENWTDQNLHKLEELIIPIIEKEREKYSYENLYDPVEIFTKSTPYEINKSSSINNTIKSDHYKYQISFDTLQWNKIDCNLLNPLADICLLSRNEKVYSIILAEENAFDLKELKAAALTNIYSAANDVVVIDKKLNLINGEETLRMGISAEIDNYSLIYKNQYISTPWGTIQMLTFTAEEDFEINQALMDEINNGLELTK